MQRLISSSLLLAIATLAGCTQQMAGTPADQPETPPLSTVNTHCPIMGHEVASDGGTTEWNGQTVGFCCPGCIDKFNALSDDEKATALAKAEASPEKHDHGGHNHGEHDESGNHGPGGTTEAS